MAIFKVSVHFHSYSGLSAEVFGFMYPWFFIFLQAGKHGGSAPRDFHLLRADL
jgi:hypothetical protein